MLSGPVLLNDLRGLRGEFGRFCLSFSQDSRIFKQFYIIKSNVNQMLSVSLEYISLFFFVLIFDLCFR